MKYLKTTTLKTFAATLIALAFLVQPNARVLGQGPGAGQDKGTSRSKVERKNRAPVSKEVLQVKLRKPVETTLENGLTVLILEDHRLPLASVQLNITGAGPIVEPRETAGLANITAQMLREGTKTRNSRQIAEDVEKLGATVDTRMERWVVMRAPSGQRFCVVRVQRDGFEKTANSWS